MHHLVSEDLKLFKPFKGRLVWAKIQLMLTEQNNHVESGQAISQVPQLLSVGILTSLVNKEWTHQNRFIIKISTCTAQLFTAPFICISCSRRTGQYTVQQNTHGDRHGPSTTADATKPNQPLPIPRSQPYCSPKNSPNSRSRRPPSCQRCNSQVGETVNSDIGFFWETYWRKVVGVFAFRVLNIVFCFVGCVSVRSRSSKVMFRPATFFLVFFLSYLNQWKMWALLRYAVVLNVHSCFPGLSGRAGDEWLLEGGGKHRQLWSQCRKRRQRRRRGSARWGAAENSWG